MKSNLSKIELNFNSILQKRTENKELRELLIQENVIDFFSNDYLGLSRDSDFHHSVFKRIASHQNFKLGATGSRLISGNFNEIEALENQIADVHKVESALFFSSGYNANLALFSCIASRKDTILIDQLVHRSVYDGCRLSFATIKKFKHNDLVHLESLLQKYKGNCFVAIESLYSMDGDFAPLIEILALTEKYNAALIVDEAHAFAVFGLGKVNELHLQNRVFASLMTYGKGLGCDGASILGSEILKKYLINFASPFIYSTAPSLFQVVKISEAYHKMHNIKYLQHKLQLNIKCFRSFGFKNNSDPTSPIQIIFIDNLYNLEIWKIATRCILSV